MNNNATKIRSTGFQIMKRHYLFSFISLLLLALSGCDINNEQSRVPQPIPLAATNVQAINSIDDVTISWNASEHATEYVLYRCPINTVTRQCDTTSVSACGSSVLHTSALSAVDDTLTATDVFCYGVQACNSDNCSDISEQELGYLLPANSLILAVSGADSVVESQTVSLHAATQKTTGNVTFAWSQTSGRSVTLSDSSAADVSFTSPMVSTAETLVFTVTVTDDNGSVSKAVSVIVNDDAIFVDAGNSMFAPAGQTVSLHGIGNGAGGSPDYAWQQISGPSVSLTDSNTPNPIFVTPLVTVDSDLIFELTFFDGIADAKDRVTVSIPGPVHTPSPNAPLIPVGAFAAQPLLVTAPQWLAVAELTTDHKLTAVASGGDGNYSYAWTNDGPTPSGQLPATLTDASNQVASVDIPDVTATTLYDFTVTVTDGAGHSDSTIVQIQAADGPALATLAVIAPPLTVSEGPIDAVLSASAIGGTGPYTFRWLYLTGPVTVVLRDATTANARFAVPDVNGDAELTFLVATTDAVNATASRVVKVIVRDAFAHTPLQRLRLQALPPAQLLEGGSASFAVVATGGDKIYSWSWTQTSGTPATISGENTNSPIITAPNVNAEETLSFQVTVTDGLAETVSETVSITALPVASTQPLSMVTIPDLHIDEGLQGAAIIGLAQGGTGNYIYSWHYDQQDPALNITLSDSDKSVAHFDVPGVSAKTVLRFELTINDGISSINETVYVVVNDLYATLKLGHLQDQRVHSGDAVYLNGAAASGGVPPYTYAWSETTSSGFVINPLDFDTNNANFEAGNVSSSIPVTLLYVVTDAVGNSVSVSETVIIDPTVAPLHGSLNGPTEAAGGQDISLNSAVLGGIAPYVYTYSTSGLQFTLPATANPTVTLPTVFADTTMTITLLVHDSATPENTFSVDHLLKVTAPVAAGLAPGSAAACGDQATGMPCSLLELVLIDTITGTCPADSPYGMTDIYQYGKNDPHYVLGAGQVSGENDATQTLIYKRCVNERICDEQYFQATSDKPLCLNFDGNLGNEDFYLVCHLCCYSAPGQPACNTLDVPPKDTLYRP